MLGALPIDAIDVEVLVDWQDGLEEAGVGVPLLRPLRVDLDRFQGHGIRVLDEAYSEQLAEFEERAEPIDPVFEIEAARELVWGRVGKWPRQALRSGSWRHR